MRFKIVLHASEEGFAVFALGLRGCCSQGGSREEALENISDAIREYLAAAEDTTEIEEGGEIVELDVP